MPKLRYLEQHDKTTCFGCSACVAACRSDAIRLVPDGEGFLYPEVDREKCTECGACARACPFGKEGLLHARPGEAYALQAKDADELKASSSGGAFALLAKQVVDGSGWACGCVLEDCRRPRHIVSGSLAGVDEMRGSKYVQSDMGGCFSEVAGRLKAGERVLFSGTPCQVAGLRAFLGSDRPNLTTVDLVCHGVPSPSLLEGYIDSMAPKKGEIVSLCFRDKERNGWCANGTIEWVAKSGTKRSRRTSPHSDTYYYYYLANAVNRECCYACPFARLERASDLTIGDYWNAESASLGFDWSQGTSAVLVNTRKGAEALEKLKGLAFIEPVSTDHVVAGNGNLAAPSPRPPLRDRVYADIASEGYERASKRLCRLRPLSAALRRLVPNHLKKLARRFANGR